MAKENIICGTFRLNMNNPQHVKINEVIRHLNPKIYKSKNQFLVEAAIFYIEHYGEAAFMEPEEKCPEEYLTKADLESIKAEMIETATTEARQEVIRVLGGVISGMQVPPSVGVVPAEQQISSVVSVADAEHQEESEEPQEETIDDEVVAGCALSWMMNGEGDDE